MTQGATPNRRSKYPGRPRATNPYSDTQKWAIKQSMERWVSPEEIQRKFRRLCAEVGITPPRKALKLHLAPGAEDCGLLHGSDPFGIPVRGASSALTHAYAWARQKFIRHRPKVPRAANAELLILKLISEGMQRHAR